MTGPVRGLALAVAAAAGCSGAVTVRPVIESPPDERLFRDLDTIEMWVSIDGEADPLVTSVFRRGETIELSEVPYGENLVVHMRGSVNNSEVAYGRTCRFAVRAGEAPPEPHLYFARTVSWADAPVPPNAVRSGGAALTSRNGSALYFGGLDENGTPVLGADRFDPATGQFTELTRLAPRRAGSAASLGDGRAILVGGVDGEDQVAEHIDVVSIDANADEVVEPVAAEQLSSRTAPALATLSDGNVVAIGGLDLNWSPFPTAYGISNEGGALVISELSNARLRYPRHGHTVTRLSDDLGAPVLIAGGRDAGGMPVPTAELYRPLTERIAPETEFAKQMLSPRWDHAAVRLPDGSVLIVGGRNAGGPIRQIEVFTVEAGFVVQESLPLGSGLTEFTATALPDGRVLIAGGRDLSGEPVDAVQIVRIDSFGGGINLINTDRLSIPRAGHQATLLCDGTVLLVGGTPGAAPAERYNPPSAGRR